MKKVLVIAPHPDDEVLGCGGTIARLKKEGNEIYLVVVTKTYAPDWPEAFTAGRKAEVAKANSVLGIKKSFFLEYPTVKLDTISQKELNDALQKVVGEVLPNIVFIPHHGDLNRDHRIVFESALVALRPHPGATCEAVYSYEVLSETEWGTPFQMFIPNFYSDISATLHQKLAAMDAYASELKGPPHPRSSELITVLAKKRGSEVGVGAAEAFMLIRGIQY